MQEHKQTKAKTNKQNKRHERRLKRILFSFVEEKFWIRPDVNAWELIWLLLPYQILLSSKVDLKRTARGIYLFSCPWVYPIEKQIKNPFYEAW